VEKQTKLTNPQNWFPVFRHTRSRGLWPQAASCRLALWTAASRDVSHALSGRWAAATHRSDIAPRPATASVSAGPTVLQPLWAQLGTDASNRQRALLCSSDVKW